MRAPGVILTISLLVFSLTLPISSASTSDSFDFSRATAVENYDLPESSSTHLTLSADSRGNYNGNLKVYMVEKESRWKDYTNYYHYERGFLDFAFDTVLSLPYHQTYQQTKIWDARAAGWASDADSVYIRENNMMAIAVLFNSESDGINHSDPYYDDPEGAPFTIYPVDASAEATPGLPGYDTAYGSSTHTVFIEEGTEHT
jgi:hypothetical protein